VQPIRLRHLPRPRFAAAARLVTLAAIVVSAIPRAAEAQTAPFPSRDQVVAVDSGWKPNPSSEYRVVWSRVFRDPEAVWLRLRFDRADLDRNPETGEASFLRITSLKDLAEQRLDPVSVWMWRNSSAYFNGDAVAVELVAAPRTARNRLGVATMDVGLPIVDPESICGPDDDRMLSEDDRVGRVMPVGCTGWIIDDETNSFLSAGHCGPFAGRAEVIEFNVPLSDSNGVPQRSHPDDQYPIDPESIQRQDRGRGGDWMYFGAFPNSNTCRTAFQAQGAAFDLVDPPAPDDQEITITGYGTTGSGVPREWNQAQKTHTGDDYDRSGDVLSYRTDTTGGNSGSPVILAGTNDAIGIHTHGGCNRTGGDNDGTASNDDRLQNALENPKGAAAPLRVGTDRLVSGEVNAVRVVGATPGRDVYFYHTFEGTGTTMLPDLCVSLGLRNAVLDGVVEANDSGVAVLRIYISTNVRNNKLWGQAATLGKTTRVRTYTIQ